MQPSAIDLTTVAAVENWIYGFNKASGSDPFVIQMLISALSLRFLRDTGRAAQNGSVPSLSPFNQAVSYSESYTGNGNQLIQLRNSPILTVSSVSIFGNPLQLSSGPSTYGYFIEASGKFLGIRAGGGYSYAARTGGNGWAGWGNPGNVSQGGWPKEQDCIQVNYSAGYAANAVPNELQTIPPTPAAWAPATFYGNGQLIFDGTNIQMAQVIAKNNSTGQSGSATPGWAGEAGSVTADGAYLAWINQGLPYIVVVNNLPWLSDAGVSYFSSGNPLTPVLTAPAAGQYNVMGGGSYLFASADAGQQVQINYNYAGTPLDIQESMLRWVDLIYKRRGWEGIRSLMGKEAGSTTYTSFEVDPSVRVVIDHYTRRQ